MLKSDFNSLLIARSSPEATLNGIKVKQIISFDEITSTDCVSTLREKASGRSINLVLSCLEPEDTRWATKRRLISDELQRIDCTVLMKKADRKAVNHALSNVNDITLLMETQNERDALIVSLGERMKEQRLLYRAIKLLYESGDNTHPEEVLDKLVHLVPSGWHYPEHTEASINMCNGQVFETPAYSEIVSEQKADFKTWNGGRGTITVGYTETFPDINEGPFMMEERALIDNLATIISSYFDKHTALKRLNVEQSNLSALINNTDDLIWSVDSQLKLVKANIAFRQSIEYMAGAAPAEGDSVLFTQFSKEQLIKWAGFYDRALNGEAFRVEESYHLEDGSWYYSEISLHPMVSDDNHIYGISCMSRNITEKKQRIIQIEEQYKRLQDIAWTQSHLVRAPVANIQGLVQLLNNDNLADPKNFQVIEKIKIIAHNLDHIVREVVKQAEKPFA